MAKIMRSRTETFLAEHDSEKKALEIRVLEALSTLHSRKLARKSFSREEVAQEAQMQGSVVAIGLTLFDLTRKEKPSVLWVGSDSTYALWSEQSFSAKAA